MQATKTPNTTIVIPNYNGIGYLKDCLASIFAGETVPHVIVVDNGSTDGSVEWLKAAYPQVEALLFHKNTGFCQAVNAGIKNSRTDYVILLNNDTVVTSGFVTAMEAAMEQDKNIFSAGAKMLNMSNPRLIDDAGDFYSALGWAFARGKNKSAAIRKYNKPGDIFAACAGAAIYRRAQLAQLGYFDNRHFAYLEDIDIGYRAQIYGYRNVYVPDAVVRHVGSGTSGSRYNQFKVEYSARNNIYLIYKNMPMWQIVLNLPFLLAGFLLKGLFFMIKGMGKDYVRGLRQGIRLSSGADGRNAKVPCRPENRANYWKIQWQLYRNLFFFR